MISKETYDKIQEYQEVFCLPRQKAFLLAFWVKTGGLRASFRKIKSCKGASFALSAAGARIFVAFVVFST